MANPAVFRCVCLTYSHLPTPLTYRAATPPHATHSIHSTFLPPRYNPLTYTHALIYHTLTNTHKHTHSHTHTHPDTPSSMFEDFLGGPTGGLPGLNVGSGDPGVSALPRADMMENSVEWCVARELCGRRSVVSALTLSLSAAGR